MDEENKERLSDILCGDLGPEALMNNHEAGVTRIDSFFVDNELIRKAVRQLQTALIIDRDRAKEPITKLAVQVLLHTFPQ